MMREISCQQSGKSDKDTSFHGGEIKGYENSTSAGIVPADSLRKDAVKEEWFTFIAHGIVHDLPPPETPGAGSTLKCNDAIGEVNDVTFSRDQVRVSSCSDDAIKTTVETRAGTVAGLA